MGARNLPYHDLLGMIGLQTNLSPRTVAGRGSRASKNLDGYEEFRSIGAIPGSEIINQSGRLGPVQALHYFEYFDYDETDKKKLLAVALDATPPPNGPGLYDVVLSDTPGSQTVTRITDLDVDGLYFSAIMNNRIHLSAPREAQGYNGANPVTPTGGVKYDGTVASRWGVMAPGTEEVTFDPIDDNTAWAASGTGAPVLSDEANSRRFDIGVGLRITVNGSPPGSRTGTMTKGYASVDMDPNGTGTIYVWVFVPPGELRTNPTLDWNVTQLGPLTETKTFEAGDLITGWNLLSFTPAVIALTQVISMSFDINQNFTHTGGTWVFNFLHGTDRGECDIAAVSPSATTGVSYPAGDYTARVTYLNEYGLESNAGTISDSITVSPAEASGTVTLGGGTPLPAVNDTLTVQGDTGARVYTFVAAVTGAIDEIVIAINVNQQVQNIIAAIESDTTVDGTAYGNAVVNAAVTASGAANVLTITAIEAAAAGNAYPLAVTGAWTPVLSGATLAGGADSPDIAVTNIPIAGENSSSPLATGVIARRIYLDFNGDFVHRFAAQIDDNVTTSLTLNEASGALGLATPPLAGDALLDNSPPAPFAALEVHQNRVFGVKGEAPNTLAISDPGEAESFPLLNEVIFNRPITALQSALRGLLIFTSDETYILFGNGTTQSPFVVEQQNDELGANGPRSVGVLRGDPFIVREREVFTATISTLDSPWYVSGPVQDQFNRDWALDTVSDMFVINDRARFRMLMFVKEAVGADPPDEVNSFPGQYNQVYAYQYGTIGFSQITGEGSGTDPQDPRVAAWHQLVLPVAFSTLPIDPLCAAVGERGSEIPEVWVGSSDGYINQFQPPGVEDWNVFIPAPTSAIGPIEVQPKIIYTDVPLGADNGGRGEPRYLKMNVENTGSADEIWSFTVRVFDEAGMDEGDERGSSTWTTTIAPGSHSFITPVPAIGARGDWARVEAFKSGFGSDGALLIKDIQLHFIPRAINFYGPRAR